MTCLCSSNACRLRCRPAGSISHSSTTTGRSPAAAMSCTATGTASAARSRRDVLGAGPGRDPDPVQIGRHGDARRCGDHGARGDVGPGERCLLHPRRVVGEATDHQVEDAVPERGHQGGLRAGIPLGAGILVIMADEIPLRGGVAIPRSELSWRFSRSSGPGGQSVNTADSRVELRWNLAESGALPSGPPGAGARTAGRPPGRRGRWSSSRRSTASSCATGAPPRPGWSRWSRPRSRRARRHGDPPGRRAERCKGDWTAKRARSITKQQRRRPED